MNTDKTKSALELGEYELKGQFMLGSNYTFLVDVHHEGENLSSRLQAEQG